MAYPVIAAVAASATPADSASHVCALPSGIAVGNLLLAVVVVDGDAAMTWPAGWTEITNGAGVSGTAVRSEARYRIATGSEDASITITGSNEAWVSRVWRITSHAGTAPECAALTGTSADAAFPSLIPSWGGTWLRRESTLWLFHVGWDTRPAFTFWPAFASVPQFERRSHAHVSDAGGGAGSVQQASARVRPSGASGPCTSASAAWRSLVLAVEPDVTALRTTVYGGTGWQEAVAAPPTFQARGTGASGPGALTVGWPTHLTDDIGLLCLQTAQEAIAVNTPTGWAAVGTAQGAGSPGAGGASRLSVFWKRAASAAEASVVTTDSGAVQAGVIYTFRGCILTGDPWDVTAGDVLGTPSSAIVVPSVTTTVPQCLLVALASDGIPNTSTEQSSGWANPNLTGLTPLGGVRANSSPGGGVSGAYGVKAAAGVVGTTTATLASSSNQARLVVALMPTP